MHVITAYDMRDLTICRKRARNFDGERAAREQIKLMNKSPSIGNMALWVGEENGLTRFQLAILGQFVPPVLPFYPKVQVRSHSSVATYFVLLLMEALGNMWQSPEFTFPRVYMCVRGFTYVYMCLQGGVVCPRVLDKFVPGMWTSRP